MKLSTFAGLGLLAVTAMMMSSTSVVADMQIDNYSSSTNDRFYDGDDKSFFLDNFFVTYDLSGVGQDESGRWATLIGPNTIISANHFEPSGTISFYPDNSTRVKIDISLDMERIGNTDLWLARLKQHAPANIHVFDYANDLISPPSDNAPFPYKGDSVIMTGRSESDFPITQDQAYGTNIISGFEEDHYVEGTNGTVLGTLDVFELRYDSGATDYESFLQGDDSGAPLFTEKHNGEPLLLGVNSYITTNATTGDPIASYVSYIGNEAATVDALVTEWAAVPEPSSFFSFVTVALLLGFALRRRVAGSNRSRS